MDTSNLTTIHEFSELVDVPIARVAVEHLHIKVELSDEVKLAVVLFRPYQALRVTTLDCVEFPEGSCVAQRAIMEVNNSRWLADLTHAQSRSDRSATFMSKARHFVVPALDDVIEIVAWEYHVLQAIPR